MSDIFKLKIKDILPEKTSVPGNLGYSDGRQISDPLKMSLNEAMGLFRQTARPTAILKEITVKNFITVFEGEGRNDPQALLQKIYPEAEHPALFVLTLGKKLTDTIQSRFAENDFLTATVLDAIASSAADKAITIIESNFQAELKNQHDYDENFTVLAYSPGYCGWHISAQKKLFDYLNPSRIGLSLTESYLMTPIKSVSGVLLGGDMNIHLFGNNFSYCRECKTVSCIERMQRIQNKKQLHANV